MAVAVGREDLVLRAVAAAVQGFQVQAVIIPAQERLLPVLTMGLLAAAATPQEQLHLVFKAAAVVAAAQGLLQRQA
jgi:hypothetical protein